MSKPLVSAELWAIVGPLLPPEPPKPKGGRPRVPDRAALAGILFVLRTGCPWEWLPRELGCGSGITCWRRLRDWQRAGERERRHEPEGVAAEDRGEHVRTEVEGVPVDEQQRRRDVGAGRDGEQRERGPTPAPGVDAHVLHARDPTGARRSGVLLDVLLRVDGVAAQAARVLVLLLELQ